MANIMGAEKAEVLVKLVELQGLLGVKDNGLNNWEQDFIKSMYDRYELWGDKLLVSEKQAKIITDIYEDQE